MDRLFWMLLTGLLAGCAAGVPVVEEPTARQVSRGGDYKRLSECLFRQMKADGHPVDLEVFSCSRQARLAAGADGEAIRVDAMPGGGEGAVVRGSGTGMVQLNRYLEQCTLPPKD
ncbi:MAG: hypothetical protein HQL95_07230 [Magnetococcales bacterium]|nr:hypothetical protein [Magnetococcales bacterium]